MRSTKLFLISLPMFAAASAHGQISYSDLFSPVDNSQQTSTGLLADSFSVGANAAWLTDVTLSLENPAGTGGTFTVALESDNNVAPSGAELASATISDTMVNGNSTWLDVSLSPTLLSANTRYWIALIGPSSGVTWDYTLDTSGPGVAYEFVYGNGLSQPNTTGEPFMMQLTPEPSSFAYLGLGILPMVCRRRKKV